MVSSAYTVVVVLGTTYSPSSVHINMSRFRTLGAPYNADDTGVTCDDVLTAVAINGLRDCNRPGQFIFRDCSGGNGGGTYLGGISAGFDRALGGAGLVNGWLERVLVR